MQKSLEARAERKLAKKEARATIRGTKRRDILIQQQDHASASALINRQVFAQKREAFDMLYQNILEIHAKQIRNLTTSQERKLETDKTLNDLEFQHLKDEVRRSMAKTFRIIEYDHRCTPIVPIEH